MGNAEGSVGGNLTRNPDAADIALLKEYEGIAQKLMPEDFTVSFMLLDIDDLTSAEQRYMAETLRQFRARDLPPHNLDLLERLYHDLCGELQAADRNTLGGLIEYVRERTVGGRPSVPENRDGYKTVVTVPDLGEYQVEDGALQWRKHAGYAWITIYNRIEFAAIAALIHPPLAADDAERLEQAALGVERLVQELDDVLTVRHRWRDLPVELRAMAEQIRRTQPAGLPHDSTETK